MTIFQRIKNVFTGLVTLGLGILFIMERDNEAYVLIIIALSLGLAVRAVRDIIYYFTMARHMIGGKMILFQGVILLDFALLTASLSDVSKVYILLYLIAIHAFSGMVEILRAMEAKRTVEGPWKIKFSHGIINLLLALACLLFIKNIIAALIIYGIGLVYSGIMRIISAMRRTTFILIG
ncbi:MAG: hypothetical protein J5829_01685 [Lachnospiraceae bacterium]|nr:hypothetical protein [Lachnospiraceae bacterium]